MLVATRPVKFITSVWGPAVVLVLEQLNCVREPQAPEYAYITSCLLVEVTVTVAIELVATNLYQPSRDVEPPEQPVAIVGSFITASDIVPPTAAPFTVKSVAFKQSAP
ncbi:MAG: hypothetical protein CTY35_14370 [Methylotenera sp.]|nr:MAG: hypothetical protein CTY35_14370 [Methylotenera sp.]